MYVCNWNNLKYSLRLLKYEMLRLLFTTCKINSIHFIAQTSIYFLWIHLPPIIFLLELFRLNKNELQFYDIDKKCFEKIIYNIIKHPSNNNASIYVICAYDYRNQLLWLTNYVLLLPFFHHLKLLTRKQIKQYYITQNY